ncbi:hypothetical protein FACS1894166_13560 [Bacilli bacterium]|nr:hypothetical protein FACS1894166_13560 [Bacilli bacterium]
MFENCEKLEVLDLRNFRGNICSAAFAGCKNLKQILLGVGPYTFGDKCFSGCQSLEELDISKIEKINFCKDCFEYCDNLKTIKWPEDLNKCHSSHPHQSLIRSKVDVGELLFDGVKWKKPFVLASNMISEKVIVDVGENCNPPGLMYHITTPHLIIKSCFMFSSFGLD